MGYISVQVTLENLPDGSQRGNQLPPLPHTTQGKDVPLTADFFTTPGKVKVPFVPSGSQEVIQGKQPIHVDDGGNISP